MASGALAPSVFPVNGASSQSIAEEDELYAQLLRLRDDVVTGKNTSFKLPAAAIERLRASLLEHDAQSSETQHASLNFNINNSAFATNQHQLHQASTNHAFGASPAVQATSTSSAIAPPPVYDTPSAPDLHPIFLQKSDVVVRAEGQLKRQRLDRDLQTQVDQRKNSSRDKEAVLEATSPVDVVAVLSAALELVKPFSGLKEADEADDSSSFDENDYYSSQVQSDWSSEASTSKGSDHAPGAFTADFERLDAPLRPIPATSTKISSYRLPAGNANVYSNDPEESSAMGDEDDEYTPPDAAAFDSLRKDDGNMVMGQVTPPEDDHSDYEPGEITDSNTFTPQDQVPQKSPRVPVIRNHLTHIVAPQPNRVSPLATAKGASYELELVNGRPEMVPKKQAKQKNVHSRASTASPSGNGMSGLSKKQRQKKRKRGPEPTGRAKRRKDKQPATSFNEPYIKDEPVSPPSFASFRDVPPYHQAQNEQQPVSIDLSSPRYVAHQQQAEQFPGQSFRQANVQASSPALIRPPTPPWQRTRQRDTQDPSRVASLQYAQRLSPPQQSVYSPIIPYRTVSAVYGESNPRLGQDYRSLNHMGSQQGYNTMEAYSQQVRSPAANLENRPSQVAMPPPPAPPQKVIVDQHGNRYFAADTVPAPISRPSARPTESMPPPASSRKVSYHHLNQTPGLWPSTPAASHEPMESRGALPPRQSARPLDPYVEQVGNNGYDAHDTEAAPRYADASGYSNHPSVRAYEQVPLLPQQQPVGARESLPFYIQNRSYSVRPEDAQPFSQANTNYLRHASVAPVQYVGQDAGSRPMRAVSVMPVGEYGVHGTTRGLIQQQIPQSMQRQGPISQTPGAVRYVDQYGNEVFPHEVREVRY